MLCIVSCSTEEYDMFSTIYGSIYDSANGEPMPNASVILSPGGETKITGNDGQYIFEDIEARQYTITVQKEGYYTNRKTATAIIGEETEYNIPITRI